jgi:glutathione S-transferase
MRARMALIESGIDYILREVNLKDKPPHLLEISPKGTVPVLLFPDGKVIEESLDIIFYATQDHDLLNIDQYDAGKQLQIKALIHNNDTGFIKLVNPYKYPDRFPDQSPDLCRQEIEGKFLAKYESMLSNSPFLFGKKSLADIAILPFVRQFAKVDEEWFWESKYSNLIIWVKSFIEEDSFKNVVMLKNKPLVN